MEDKDWDLKYLIQSQHVEKEKTLQEKPAEWRPKGEILGQRLQIKMPGARQIAHMTENGKQPHLEEAI